MHTKAETQIINQLKELHELHPDLTELGRIQYLLSSQRTDFIQKVEALEGTKKHITENIWLAKDYVLRENVLKILKGDDHG